VVSKIYLAGPISLDGRATESEQATFMRQFSHHCAALRNKGFVVLNPCELSPQETWEEYMRLTIPMVCEAHAVAVLPQWRRSRGSRLEVFIALEIGKPVIEVEELYDNDGPDSI